MKKHDRRKKSLVAKVNRKKSYRAEKSLVISFGSKFSLFVEPQRDRILSMLKAAKEGKSKLYYVDFRGVEEINPHTLLHVLQTLRRYSNERFLAHNFKAPLPRGVFEKFGINEFFRLPKFPKKLNSVSIDGWRLFTGTEIDFSKDGAIEHMKEFSNYFPKKFALKLVTGISEAIANVVHHAYKDNKGYKEWYMLTHVDKKSVTVLVSDLGVSIPFNIENQPSDNKFSNCATDSRLIKIATESEYSTVGIENGRGKGFDDILDLGRTGLEHDEIRSVYISVLSRRGSYTLFADSDKKVERSYNDRLDDFSRKIQGTIIAWVIELK